MSEPAGHIFKALTDEDPLMFAAEQAILMLKAAMVHCNEAQTHCDHDIVRAELDAAYAAIDLAECRLGNAQGCQLKRIHEEDPEDW